MRAPPAQAHRVELHQHDVADHRLGQIGLLAQRKGDVVEDQRSVNRAPNWNSTPMRRRRAEELVAVARIDHLAVEGDRARVGGMHAADQAQQRGLAAARAAQDGRDLAALEAQRDVVEDGAAGVVPERDVVDLDQGSPPAGLFSLGIARVLVVVGRRAVEARSLSHGKTQRAGETRIRLCHATWRGFNAAGSADRRSSSAGLARCAARPCRRRGRAGPHGHRRRHAAGSCRPCRARRGSRAACCRRDRAPERGCAAPPRLNVRSGSADGPRPCGSMPARNSASQA